MLFNNLEMCQNNWSPSSLTILRIFGDQQNTHRVVQVSFSGECKKFECRNIQHDLHVWFLVSHLSRCSDPAQCIATTKLSWQLIVRSATSPPCPSSSLHAAMADIMLNKYQLISISIKSYFGLQLCWQSLETWNCFKGDFQDLLWGRVVSVDMCIRIRRHP